MVEGAGASRAGASGAGERPGAGTTISAADYRSEGSSGGAINSPRGSSGAELQCSWMNLLQTLGLAQQLSPATGPPNGLSSVPASTIARATPAEDQTQPVRRAGEPAQRSVSQVHSKKMTRGKVVSDGKSRRDISSVESSREVAVRGVPRREHKSLRWHCARLLPTHRWLRPGLRVTLTKNQWRHRTPMLHALNGDRANLREERRT